MTILKSVTSREQLVNSCYRHVSQATSIISRLTFREARTSILPAFLLSRTFAHYRGCAIASFVSRPLAPSTNRHAPHKCVRFLMTETPPSGSSHRQLNIRFVIPTKDTSPSTRVQCSVRVPGLMKRGEWHTFFALKFMDTDKFQRRRIVYLAVDQPEPDEGDELAQWPEESFLIKQRNTEIQVLSAQPDADGEEKRVLRTLKVTERRDYSGRLFWREVLVLARYRAVAPPTPWSRLPRLFAKAIKRWKDRKVYQDIRTRFMMRRKARNILRSVRKEGWRCQLLLRKG